MTPEAHMEFQLSQAKFRAVIATLSVVCGVAIPFFGFLGYRYVENMDAASSAVGRLITEIAVLNTQMTYLREVLNPNKGTVRSQTYEFSATEGGTIVYSATAALNFI